MARLSGKVQVPLYRKITEALVEEIRSGALRPGDAVPSEKVLAEQFGVSRITSKHALNELANAGIVVRQPGRGSYVTELALARIGTRGNGITGSGDSAGTGPRGARWDERQDAFIGLVIQDLSQSYGVLLLSGVEEALAERGRFFALRRTRGDQQTEIRVLEELSQLVSGLIVFPVNGESYNPKLLELHLAGYPIVLVDRYLRGVAAPAVTTDNVGAAKALADRLFELGHRHIMVLSPAPEHTASIEERIDGLVEAYDIRRIPVDHSLWLTSLTSKLGDDRHQETYQQDHNRIRSLLEERREVTAVFAVESSLAVAAYDVAQELGLRVPEDLSIVCFDNPDIPTRSKTPFFTHAKQDERTMGRMAVELLLECMAGNCSKERIALPATIVDGLSTAAAR